MRGLDRIEPVLVALRAAWEANPAMRLGQLIFNATHRAYTDVPPCPPVFFIEEPDLFAGLADLGSAAQ